MKIAYTSVAAKGDLDRYLTHAADTLLAQGQKVCGVVQSNFDRSDCEKCDMDVTVLPDGPIIRISQSLGKDSKGCRLNPEALEQAVVEVQKRLSADTDVMIINKFGKHEADGRGFRAVIGTAMELDVPVLVGVNGLNKDAFVDFTGGVATELNNSVSDILCWLDRD